MKLKLIKKRLRHLYTNWIKHRQGFWCGSDIFLVSSPPTLSPNSTSHRFYAWLLGDAFADTIAIFTMKEIHLICNKKKSSQLKTLASVVNEAVEAQLIIHEKVKGRDADAEVIMDKVLSDLHVQSSLKQLSCLLPLSPKKGEEQKDHPLVVGYVAGESRTSKVLWGGSTKKKKSNDYEFHMVDIKDTLSKFASLAKVDENQIKKRLEEEKLVESVCWGFSCPDDQEKLGKDSTQGGVDIYFQALPKEAEERILNFNFEAKGVEHNLRRRGEKVQVLKLSEIGDREESSELDEWVLVD